MAERSGMSGDRLLAGHTAIVTGGTGRVGSVVSAVLARHGAGVVVQYHRSGERAGEIVAQIAASGGEATAIQADVTDERSVAELVDRSARWRGDRLLLVSAVHGQFDPTPIVDMGWSDWETHIAAIQAHFLLCKAAVPVMRQREFGRIVYISGGLARRLFEGCSAYTTAKAGLNGFCKTLAMEVGRHNITVNIVAPGKVVPADHGASTDNPDAWKELEERQAASLPLGRYATAEDVAHAVLFFLSPWASAITGQTLYVAGGEIMP